MSRRGASFGHRHSALAARDGGWRCHYCRVPLAHFADDGPVGMIESGDCYTSAPGFRFPVVDHVIPLSAGGSSELDNLVLACSWCNNHKGTQSYAGFVGARQ